jgi:chromosome partitioning protein
MVEESGLEVERQVDGPKTRLFKIEDVFTLARYIAERKPKRRPKQVVATVYAPKGGVGKTTIASNLACLWTLMGFKVIVIDLDFQSNLTLAFGYDSEITREEAEQEGIPAEQVVDYHFGHLMHEWPEGTVKLEDVIKKPFGENGPHLIPADLTLDRLETVLTIDVLQGGEGDLNIARRIAEGRTGKDPSFDLSRYDIVLFDAAPAKNRLTRGALIASDVVIAPVSMEKYSTKALSFLSQVLTELQTRYQRSPELLILGNFFLQNRLRVMATAAKITTAYKEAWIDQTIRRSEAIPKLMTTDETLPVALALPSDDVSLDIRAVAEALAARMGVKRHE